MAGALNSRKEAQGNGKKQSECLREFDWFFHEVQTHLTRPLLGFKKPCTASVSESPCVVMPPRPMGSSQRAT